MITEPPDAEFVRDVNEFSLEECLQFSSALESNTNRHEFRHIMDVSEVYFTDERIRQALALDNCPQEYQLIKAKMLAWHEHKNLCPIGYVRYSERVA